MRGGGRGSRHCGAELHTAACNGPAHPTLACVCLGGVMQIDATPLLQDRKKLFVPIFHDVGVLLFCQPSIRHQSMSNTFSLICCACTLSACSPLLAVRERQLPAVYLLHVAHALYSSDSCLSILSPYYHLLPSPCEIQSMCAYVHVSVCGYVCVCVKPGDRGVEMRTRRVSSWKAECTCALNLRATDPAQLGFRSAYISTTHCLSLLPVTCS